MTLRELFDFAGVSPARLEGDAPFVRMTMDSRRVKAEGLFVAWPSANSDAHSYLAAAREAGATCAIVHSSDGFDLGLSLGLSVAMVPATLYDDVMWRLARVAFGNPSASMKIVGVTGTNGKTTTAWLLRDMFSALGLKAGYLGTLGFQIPGVERELSNTTPFVIELNELLAEARDAGVEAMAIEVSSHALDQKRADGIQFDAGVFTNLTQDHLDFHGTMEAYAASKLRLFTELPQQSPKPVKAVLNYDDPISDSWRPQIEAVLGAGSVWGFGEAWEKGLLDSWGLASTERLLSDADVQADVDAVEVDHIDLRLLLKRGDLRESQPVRVPLGGSYNVENTTCASAVFLALGYSLEELEKVLPLVRPVPGRFEAVPNSRGVGVLVDYAHTPDALEKLLDAVRPLTSGRVITVFGCGGDRDRTKRPKMARAASERSDLTVVTSDNPRTEDPASILAEVVTGVVAGRESVEIIDRREAIAHAVSVAVPGDVVVIAGKGHENYQIIGRTKYPMDDREMAREALA